MPDTSNQSTPSVQPRLALEMRDVGFAYDRRQVLHSVDLTVAAGTFTALIGPNGGGKSTLLKLALGQLAPAQGTVRLLGGSPNDTRHRTGYLPQSSHLDPQFPITAAQVVGHGRIGQGRKFGFLSRGDQEVVARVLEDVGCADLAGRPLSELSGGQRQRVLIARALATQPELLALDEPAAGLDPESQTELYELLSKLASQLTIIVVSHHVSLVSSHVQQVVCVHDGHLHLPETATIGPELRDFFPDLENMVLVRHDHHACPDPEHEHE